MRYLTAILLALLTYKVKAQDLKLAGVEYFNYPKVQIKESQNQVQASFQEFGVYANYPTPLKNGKTIVVNGFSYGFVQSTLHNDITSIQSSHDFHKITYNFMVIHRWKERWLFVARLSPTIASDFESSFSGQDFMMQGSISIAKKLHNSMLIGGGLIYTTRLGKPMLLPSFQLRYQKERHLLNVYLPALINYSYQLDPKQRLAVGLRAAVNGANFNTANNSFPGNNTVDRLNYVRANMGPVASYQVTRFLQVEASAGLSAFRQYQFEDTYGAKYKYNSENGAFFNVGLAIVPPKKKQ